jgi:hypothetical protein
VESEDENSASYNWSIRNNQEGISSERSAAPRSPVGHRAAEGHNEHCTQSSRVGVNRFDLLLRSELN